jgi:hypothetical protein
MEYSYPSNTLARPAPLQSTLYVYVCPANSSQSSRRGVNPLPPLPPLLFKFSTKHLPVPLHT